MRLLFPGGRWGKHRRATVTYRAMITVECTAYIAAKIARSFRSRGPSRKFARSSPALDARGDRRGNIASWGRFLRVELPPSFVISNTCGIKKHIATSGPYEVTPSRWCDLWSKWKRDSTGAGRDDIACLAARLRRDSSGHRCVAGDSAPGSRAKYQRGNDGNILGNRSTHCRVRARWG